MKKLVIILFVVLSLGLFGCSSQGSGAASAPPAGETAPEKTQEQLNLEIKESAVAADFVKINADEMKGARVFVEGVVSILDKDKVMPTFTLTEKTGEGYGVYQILVIDKEYLDGIKDGDQVRVYGGVMDRSEIGMPQITGNVIELKENATSNESAWTEVIKFEGKSTKDTESFKISANEWRIVWDTNPGDLGDMNFQIFVYKSDGTLAGAAANVIGKANDASHVRGSGEYYLTINTAQPYTITVEEKK